MEHYVELFYPRSEMERTDDQPQAVIVGLMDIRAADNIRITYDFDRDGWVIAQEPIAKNGEIGLWQEVAFIQAWGLEDESRTDDDPIAHYPPGHPEYPKP